jgi:hypothetical protein
MSGWFAAPHTSTQMVGDVHRDVALRESRIIVIGVPVAALLLYVLVVRRNRGR